MKKMSILLLTSTALLFSCSKENNTLSNTKTEYPTAFTPSETESTITYNRKADRWIAPSGDEVTICPNTGTNCYLLEGGGTVIKKPTLEADRLITAINNGSIADFVNTNEFTLIFPKLEKTEILHKLKTGELTVQLAPTKDKDVMFVITKPDVTSFNTENIILASVLENYYQ